MSFGYLPKSDMETGALRTEEERIRALKNFQRFAQIKVTGKFDDKTREMMHRPRCGMPDHIKTDNNPNTRMRFKRYVIGPSKWEKKDLTYR